MYEYMRIYINESDQLIFVAHPSGASGTEFPMLKLGASEVVFANQAHDFPNTIRYQSKGLQKMEAEITGIVNDREEKIEFQFSRTSCN